MNKLFFVLTFALSLNVFAGPEEHISNQVCYDIVKQASQFVPASVPDSVCIETLSVDLGTEKIYVYSYFQAELVANLKIDSITRKNEDFFTLKASSVLKNEWQSTCGDSETTTLNIQALVDNSGNADVNYLNISVQYEVTPDSCHSIPQTEVFNYQVR